MTDFSHLSDATKEIMLLSDEERILHIKRDRWVGYDRANQIITKLEDLLVHPKIERMPNMLIIGDSNNGKTRLINHFFKKHPAHDNPLGRSIKVPVLLLEAPSSGTVEHLYKRILDLLICPYKSSIKLSDLEEQVIDVLKEIDLGIIIIDEIHNFLTGAPREQRHFLTALKTLGNMVKVPIIGVGTNAAFTAFQTDSQTANRYVGERLTKWKLDNQFLRFLASIELIIPLKDPSNLIGKQISTKIYATSEGLIGEISTLLNEAAIWSIRNSKANHPECITIESINACGYRPPSIRASYN